MLVPITPSLRDSLRRHGIESFHGIGVNIASEAVFEPPCGIKWIGIENEFRLGSFSYAVSGFFSAVKIGRYCSIGEDVQVGRASHPTSWVSTSPFFYLGQPVFDVGRGFEDADIYAGYGAPSRPHAAATGFKRIVIGNDVYVGHGACIMPGVTVGDGAVIAAMAVVTKDVPPYAIVGGNPAQIIRFRMDPMIFAQLTHLQWWRFAPWQLTGVDFSDPAAAIADLKRVSAEEAPYAPSPVAIEQLLEEE